MLHVHVPSCVVGMKITLLVSSAKLCGKKTVNAWNSLVLLVSHLVRCLFRTNANCEEKQLERKKDNWFIHLMISCCWWWLLRNTWSFMCGSEACFNFQEICANILIFIFSLATPKVSSGAVVSGIDTCSLTSKIYLCWSSFCVKIVQCEIWNEQKKEISFPFKLQEFFEVVFLFLCAIAHYCWVPLYHHHCQAVEVK